MQVAVSDAEERLAQKCVGVEGDPLRVARFRREEAENAASMAEQAFKAASRTVCGIADWTRLLRRQ
eukprot:3578371-Pleurochrysis_carterae.AAC.1